MPKAIDHDERRREIIDVAWGLIAQGGLEAATMREIASEAGFANGALKHYFPTKDDIIAGAYERALGKVARVTETATENLHGIEALRAYVRATMPFDEESHSSARVLIAFWERGLSSDWVRDSYRSHLKGWHASLVALIADCRVEGSIRTATSDEEIVNELILLNAGATALAAIGPQYATAEALGRLMDDFFARIATSEAVEQTESSSSLSSAAPTI